MDRNRTTDWEALRRIVAVLLALADLAERAGGRSLAVRSLVLRLLRPGEVLAWDYLAGLTRYAAVPSESLPFTHDSVTEAIRLATSFRTLAAALTAEFTSSRQPIAARYVNPVAVGLLAPLRYPVPAVGRRDSS
jgi:hypothetical protein